MRAAYRAVFRRDDLPTMAGIGSLIKGLTTVTPVMIDFEQKIALRQACRPNTPKDGDVILLPVSASTLEADRN
jgi:hypothetical protein